jgi:hypothetical protein
MRDFPAVDGRCGACGQSAPGCRCDPAAGPAPWRSRRLLRTATASSAAQSASTTTRKIAMHDIDRVRLELPSSAPSLEAPALEAEQFEFEGSGAAASGEVFNETENMELASGMLEVSNEADLEYFIGDLISKAGHAVGGFIRSPEGAALAGVLKGAAKHVLPAIGSYVGGPAGAAIASQAGQAFGLELEGLSNEDREFEVARRYVDFAGEAVKNLAQAAPGSVPAAAARAAAALAAATHAPGLLKAAATNALPVVHATSGQWIRHGNKVVLTGV